MGVDDNLAWATKHEWLGWNMVQKRDGVRIDRRIETLLSSVAAGNSESEFRLWDFVKNRLKSTARRKMYSRANFDEDDVASIVFTKFCFALRRGKARQIVEAQHLTRYLARSVQHTIIDLMRYDQCQKRNCMPSSVEVHDVEDLRPTQSLELRDQLSQFVNTLPSLDRQVLLGISSGCTNQELAKSLDCSVRSVERRLRHLRTRMYDVF